MKGRGGQREKDESMNFTQETKSDMKAL